MLYDDIDMSVVDAKDTFGVAKTVDPFRNSTPYDDREQSAAHKSVARKSAPKWEFSMDSKIPAKQSKKITVDHDLFFGSGNNGGSSCSSATYGGASGTIAGNVGENKITEKLHEMSTNFRDRVAVTFQEKLSVLEERDRCLRESVLKENNKNMNVIVVGTCPDMCPEKERLLREIHCSFSSFEAQIVQNEMLVVPELLVKEYARSSADQDEPLPHELRPEPVLVDTMSYILVNIVPRIEDGTVDAGAWYHFCWDRLRSIRKDIVQQQLCSVNIVTVLERSARFHICCAERLFDADERVFDHKINTENLVNCLQMLINMYDDLAALGIRCPNESEFRVYMMLLMLNSGDVPDLLNQRDDAVAEAARIYFAFKLNLYAEFFKLIKKTTYLNACILQRYFGGVRTHTLNVLVSAYFSGGQIKKFPLSFARKVFEFDNDDETVAFVEAHGFTLNVDSRGGSPEIRCSKSSFLVPDQLPVCKSSHILRVKRVPMLEAITAMHTFSPEIRILKVHSSFDESDMLKKDALWADDQRHRVIELYGNIYECSDDEATSVDESMRSETPTHSSLSSYSPKFTPEAAKVSTPPASLPSQSTFSFAAPMSISIFNFGNVHKQPSPNQFHVSQLPAFTPVANALSEADFGITPINTEYTSLEKSSSGSALYDPENLSSSDCDEPDATVPQQELVVERDENLHLQPEQVAEKRKPVEEVSDCGSPKIAPTPFKKSPSPPVCILRKSEEVAERLASALNMFQSLYYDKDAQVAPPTYASEASINSSMRLTARKLRQLVKRRLRRNKAKKYARLWRKKVQSRKRKRDNFVGIVHLSPDEYFRLWGAVGAKERSMARNLVTEVLDTEKSLRWSTALLRGDESWHVPFAGNELASTISQVPGVQSRPIVCWKTLVSLPQSRNDGQRAFAAKVSKLVRALYCKPDNLAKVGSVWCTRMQGVQICVAATVAEGGADADSMAGVTSVVMFVCEKWEKWDELKSRVQSLCQRTAYPVYIGAIVVGDSNCATYSADVSSLLDELCRRNLISGSRTTVWKRWSTMSQMVTNACHRLPCSPPFQVRSLLAFVREVGGDLFACLRCAGAGNAAAPRSPIPYIRAYNDCLVAAVRIVCMRDMRDFNLSREFAEALVGAESKTNFTHGELIAATVANDFALVSFTKWPPKSIRRLESLLAEYCAKLDSSNALLANVLRLVGAGDAAADSVEEISAQAPWLQIVELWFRYRLQSVPAEKYEKLFVIYGETEVNKLVERVAIEEMY